MIPTKEKRKGLSDYLCRKDSYSLLFRFRKLHKNLHIHNPHFRAKKSSAYANNIIRKNIVLSFFVKEFRDETQAAD